MELVVKTSTTKFDSSVDLVVALGVNSKLADQNVRDSVMLPAGSGRDVRIAVFAEDEEAKQALAAGADIAGKEVFLQQLDKGVLDFDVLVAMPQLMATLSKYAKLLGPKGLMPNPKSGTVAKDVVRAVKEAKAGRVEYRVDDNGLVHLSIGKVSFGPGKLKDNFEAVFESIKNNKPASLKGTYIKSVHLSTTMGPGLRMAVPA
ncbi:50S ribosomal protein L1 [Candidatus Saccharibacteria bacterium]|nr:50S ribosomal protein L1 [Candidatus Saccharibacteria bacterium]